MPLDIVMLGPPGAGKGTQAARLAGHYGIPAISTGDILREAVQSGSDLGRRVKAVMERGELVSDELVTDIVRERLGRPDTVNGFVLDGFPRTLPQAEALDRMVNGRGLIVLEITVPDEEIIRRLSSRRVCVGCGAIAGRAADGDAAACERCGGKMVQRSDDREEVVRERLVVYARQTKPLLDYYRGRPSFRSINGLQPPDQVFEAIVGTIEQMTATGPDGR